jgi:thiamine biosynthesis lipoprotein
VHRLEHVMGMPVGIDVRDGEVETGGLDEAFDWLRFVDRTFSTYKDDSEISRLNRGELALADAHPDVRFVLDECERLRQSTGGFFDVRPRGDALDPSGLVKGWSIDRAGAILAALGARNWSIYAGGDVLVHGSPEGEEAWSIGIQHPEQRDEIAAVVRGTDLAVATSGEYERGQHVFDPHTGLPPTGVLSVTIAGPDLATADAFATAAFAMGIDGPAWTAGLERYEALTILADGRVLSTAGFPRG